MISLNNTQVCNCNSLSNFIPDDPYYCGLRARVPNFVKTSKSSKEHKEHATNGTLVNGNTGNTNGNSNGSSMNTLSQKKNSMIHMSMTAPNLHAMHVAAPQPPPHMHPHHIQQQQLMAAAAAHAVHHHHPAAAAHHQQHHVPQHPVWQARSFESGIGIYDSSSIGCQQQQQFNAVTANFLMDHQNNNNKNNKKNKNKNKNKNQMNQAQAQQITLQAQALSQSQVQAQAQQLQQQQLHNALPQMLSAAAAMRLPADTAHGVDGHEHEHVLNNSNNNKNKNHNNNIYFSVQQQQQERQRQHHFQNLEQTRQRHHHHHHEQEESLERNNKHHHNHRHHNRNCARRQLPPNMRDCYAPLHTDTDYPDPDQLYADAQPTALTSNARSSRSRFRRLTRELQQTLSPHRFRTSRTRRDASNSVGSNCNCVSCYTLAPLFGVEQPARPPRSLSQQQLRLHQRLSGSLAEIPRPPPPPPLPPLLAAQMRASRLNNSADLDGANDEKREALAVARNKALGQSGVNLVKWCSESDVSFLNPRRNRYLAPSDTCTYDEGFGEADVVESCYGIGGARNAENFNTHENVDSPHYVNNCDYRRKDAAPYYNERKQKAQDRKESHDHIAGKKKTYNEYAMQTRRYGDCLYTADETDWDTTQFDRYTNRQRQLGSPSPPQSPFERTDVDEMQVDGERVSADNRSGFVHSPALLRHKSLSIESFFEQPNEEGSLYMYGGRKRIVKAPSTTMLYDRLRSREAHAQLNALNMRRGRTEHENRRGHGKDIDELQQPKLLHSQRDKLGMQMPHKHRVDDAASPEKPMLPPPCWRGRKNSNCSSDQLVIDNELASENTKMPTTAAKSNATTPTMSSAIKQLGGSIVAATTAAFEMKAHNQKRQQQQQKLKLQAELKQKQKQQQYLNNYEQVAKVPNDVAQAQINKLDNNNNNSKENRNFMFNNSKRNNNNGVKNTNVTTTNVNTGREQQMFKRPNFETLQQQQSQKHGQQNRLSRSDSRVDASDMESIYGYLKPRKPRSLSLKRIQILDY